MAAKASAAALGPAPLMAKALVGSASETIKWTAAQPGVNVACTISIFSARSESEHRGQGAGQE